ncbi:MAG: Crp/Fnr family transcriptional regulator [Anaerolineales bacterium]
MSFSAALSSLSHFASLPSEVISSLEQIAVRQIFAAEQLIYLEGEAADTVYLLEKGWVKAIRLSRKGREQAVLVLRAVDLFGDVAIFTSGFYPGTVMTLEDCVVWALPAAELLERLQRCPPLAQAFLHHFASRILQHLQLIEDLSLCSVEARLARTLARHAENVGGQWIVPRRPWATYDAMAARLGTVRDVLSRAMRTLEGKGLLRIEKQRIVLLDREELAEYED